MTSVADVIQAIEARGARVRLRDDGAIAIKPFRVATPTEREVLATLSQDAEAYLRGRAYGVPWGRTSLYQLDRILEVSVPWAEVSIIIAPGCRLARELRASDPQPGRVWCSHEIIDLLLVSSAPEDAQKVAAARLAFDAALVGVRTPRDQDR